MEDPIPGTTAVKDQRTPPRGVLPRHAQSWVMVAIAVGILGIILFTGQSAPPRLATGPRPALAVPDPDGLRHYQERLRALNDQARRQSTEATSEPMMTTSQPEPPASPDPLEAERKRLEYRSLFTPVMIRDGKPDESRRPTDQPDPNSMAGMPTASAEPSLDAIATAVIRASQAAGHSATASTAPPTPPSEPTSGADPSSTPPSATVARPANDPRPLYRLPEGTVIPAVLRNRLAGTFGGPVVCMVTSPVYDLPTHRVLIPAGAVLLGRAKPVQSTGDTRLAVTFHKLRLADKSEYALDQFVGANQVGDVGLRDRVDRHYLSTFGAAAAVGLLSGLSTAVGTSVLGSQRQPTIVIGGVTTEAGSATARTLEHLLNRLPTIEIGEGHRVHVFLTRDLQLPSFAEGSETPRIATGTEGR